MFVVLLCCEILIILVQTPLFVMKCCNYFCDGNLFKYYTEQPTTFVTNYKDLKHLEYFVSPKRALLLLHCQVNRKFLRDLDFSEDEARLK